MNIITILLILNLLITVGTFAGLTSNSLSTYERESILGKLVIVVANTCIAIGWPMLYSLRITLLLMAA
jgi:hypothetical protein